MAIKSGIMGDYDDDPKLPENIWLKKLGRLSARCKDVYVFKVGKNYYKGLPIYAIKEFIEFDLPEKEFTNWLNKHYKKVKI